MIVGLVLLLGGCGLADEQPGGEIASRIPPDRRGKLQEKVDASYGLFLTAEAVDDEEGRILQGLLAGTIHRYPPVISSVPVKEDPGHWIAPSLNLDVLYDGKKFRMWYDLRDTRRWQRKPEAYPAAIAYAESEDGIHWHRPALDIHPYYPAVHNVTFLRGQNYCIAVTVVDDGEGSDDPLRRFKIAVSSRTNNENRGTYIAFSPDGIHWTEYEQNPILPHEQVGDILDAYYDQDQGIYIMAYKKWQRLEGFQSHRLGQRCVGIATSVDWIHWDDKGVVLRPHQDDDHFYNMSITKIDGLYVGFLRIYQSQIGPHDGIGWTEIATSRDLIHWQRYHKPFIPRGPVGAFDHAMVWLDAPIEVGNKLYYFYGGYPLGHGHASSRGIGLLVVQR